MSFIHLHVHSDYSLVDGLIRIEELIDQTAKNKQFSVALTDHCNLFAMVKFYQTALEAGIKPIIGAHVFVHNDLNPAEPYRIILLCQNEQGYRNLTNLVSQSYLEGQSTGLPQIQKNWLRPLQQGLIVIANSEGSDIAAALRAQKEELAESLVEYWTGLFPNRFYLELTRTGEKEEESYIQAAVQLALKKNCPVVATNAARFLSKEDFDAHEARVCIHEGYLLNDPKRIKKYTEEQYLKNVEEMLELFSDLPEAIENTIEIGKRCNLTLKLGQVFLPNYTVPSGYTVEKYLSSVSQSGLEKKFKTGMDLPKAYQERLELELSVINSMGFAGYFLIVADFIRWAKEHDVPVGPGRGSGAGSLVAYALDITGLDPLQYDLLFERFLNPERVDMPDFDIDFCMEGRDRVIDYVTETYGRDSVSQIITFGTMAAKAVIRDVGRVLAHPYGFVDKIAKLIPLELGITLDKALEAEALLKKRYQEEEEVKNLIDLAKKLEGVPRNAGKHAGGVVIAASKLTDYLPLYCDANEGVLLTQFDKKDVETIGLVKFDFLGLRTLTIIDRAIKLINQTRKKNEEPPLELTQLPMQDKKTFDLLRACQTTAVFQLESRGMKDLVRRLQPDNFEEIIALVALYRPGPLQSGMVDDFINRKHGRAIPEYLHESLTPILKPTYGIILYQEQVMQIAQILAGYTLGGADLLRRAMGKKKPEEMAKQRAIFIKGALNLGVAEKKASYIFDLMEKFAGYGFNKSHSAGYAVLTYQTAWLKAHYPSEFMAAVLSCDMAHTDKVVIFIEECKRLKLVVHPPNINESDFHFTVNEQKEIVYGLGAIKGVGEAAIHSILEARKQDIFHDIYDFCARVDARKVTRRVLEALIRSGALDALDPLRGNLMAHLENALQAAEQLNKNRSKQQADLFGGSLSMADIDFMPNTQAVPTWDQQLILMGEKETLGFYFSGHPLDHYEDELSKITSGNIADLTLDKHKRCIIAGILSYIRSVQTKRGDRMAFLSLDDKTGRQEVAVFSDLFQLHREKLVKDALLIVEGELSMDDYTGGYKMRALSLMNLEEARGKLMKMLKIKINSDKIEQAFCQDLNELLKTHKGSHCSVQLHYIKKETQPEHSKMIKTILNLSATWKVNPNQTLIQSLNNLTGIEAVECCY